MPKLTSKVWQYFAFKPDNPKVTICQVSINSDTGSNEKCNKSMSYSSSSTSAMARHLKKQHNIHIDGPETSSQSSNYKQTSEQFYPKQSINSASEAIVRCALDGMSVDTILNSEILKDYLDKVHHSQMPKTVEEIKEKILEYYHGVVEKHKLLFEYFKTKNGRYSMTLDCVLIKPWRYTHWTILIVHCNVDSKIKSFVLAYSERKLQSEEVLGKFGLDLESDIVGCTHISKLSMLSNKVINQFCVKSTIITTIQSIIYNNCIYQWTKTLSGFFLNKKRSEILKKYVVVGKEKEFKFISDKKDVWITTKNMMERLVLLQPYIKQAFDSGELIFTEVKYKRENVYYDEHRFCDLKNIVECLKLLEKAIGELDESNSNLFTADETIKNVFIDLGKIDSDFGKQFVHKLNEEYTKVRNQDIVSLMYFLEHQKYPMDRFECFEYSTKAEIIQTSNDLNQRLFSKKNLKQSFDKDLNSHFELTETTAKLTLPLQRLNKALLNIRPIVTFKNAIDISKIKLNDFNNINEIVFLQANFLSNVGLLRNEKAIPMSKLHSQVWNYFILKPDNAKVTICQITSNNIKCNKSMSYSSSSTSAMARHLKSQHNIDIDPLKNKSKLQTVKRTNSLIKESNKSLGEILSRCVLERMSISTITNSEVIRDYIDKVHHLEMPNSENEIKELIVQFYDQAVDEYRNIFEHFKSKGTRFSLTSNDYYSDWCQLIVHCNVDSKIETFFLAMYCQRYELDKTLRIFGLDLNSDIIAGTCDNDKVELHKGIIKQFCMKEVIKRALFNLEYYGIFKWQSGLYEFFRSSTHNLNVLQKYVDVGDGEKIEFVFKGYDWISMVQKAEQLLRLQPYIKEAFESGELQFNEFYTKSKVYYDQLKFNELQNLVHRLKPLVEAQEKLDKPNSNLLTAEVVMKYVFIKLRQIDSYVSREMIDNLNVKYRKVRNQNIVSLMYFLKHRKYPIDRFEIFEYSSKDEIIETANNLNQRLFLNKYQQIPFTNSPNSSNSLTLTNFLKSELCDTTQDVHFDGDLTSHFDSAQKTKTLTLQLERLNNALMSIRPSVFEYYETEFDELNNKLNFLKHYFISKDAKQINQQKRPLEQ